jgi:hypothetical protein
MPDAEENHHHRDVSSSNPAMANGKGVLWIFFFLLSVGCFQEKSVPKSKYEEDVFINNHTSVWGSW